MSKKIDKFEKLKNIDAPMPSKNRRAASIEAAMLAFDTQEQTTTQNSEKEKNKNNFQGNIWQQRLTSIFNKQRRTWNMTNNWIMDKKIPLGFAAVALIAFPLAWQLTSTTPLIEENELLEESKSEILLDDVAQSKPETLSTSGAPTQGQELVKVAPSKMQTRTSSDSGVSDSGVSYSSAYSPKMTSPVEMPVPMPMGQSGDNFAEFENSPLFITAQNPVSTFSIDVDTASYSYVRRQLEDGFMPQENAVRVEEIINYFSYDYAAPQNLDVPFSQSVAIYPTPWNEATKLLHIGIKGYSPELSERQSSNLVLLIDSSGSMSSPDKLPLLKRSFSLLLDQLDENDTISIVAYAGSAGVVLEPTKANEKRKILKALEQLDAGGSTAGGEGIELAYDLAIEAKTNGSNNRVILATDGDFNVGISSPDQLKKFIEKKRDNDISLSVLGFGSGNYNDALMQSLAQNGNGNAYYIDNFLEAKKVFVEDLQGTLITIAKDVKIQIEFNPATVAEYRLVGYETRALKQQDFNNDKVDAGDIGAGHTVTAIYEITPVGSSATMSDPLRYENEKKQEFSGNEDEYAYLKLRYKLPNENISKLLEQSVPVSLAKDSIDEVSAEFRFGASVAAFGQKLRGDKFAAEMSYQQIKELGQSGRGEDKHGYRAEFLSLVDLAGSLSGEVVKK
jgi:Ca-activated chloride channel family protein